MDSYVTASGLEAGRVKLLLPVFVVSLPLLGIPVPPSITVTDSLLPQQQSSKEQEKNKRCNLRAVVIAHVVFSQ